MRELERTKQQWERITPRRTEEKWLKGKEESN